MRWNCPHCNVALSVADEQLGQGWCFSKCYQCSGFSLVRASGQGALKIDGKPPASPPPIHQFKPSQRVVDATRRAAPPKFTPPPAASAAPASVPSAPKSRSPFARFASGAALTVGAYALYSWVTTPMPVAKAPVIPQAVIAQAAPVAAPSEKLLVTDSIARGAMAPERAQPAISTPPAARPVGGLEVESLSPRVQLRSGPGIQYPVVATVDPKHTYPVIDWSERWFRVALELNGDGSGKKFAWVRNDLVKLVRKGR